MANQGITLSRSAVIVWPEALSLKNSGFVLLLAILAVAAYSPALNNGFISDDFIMLRWADDWSQDPYFIFRIVPDSFRVMGYVIYRILRVAFGYRPEVFYGFSILLHWVNAILLWRLIGRISRSGSIAAFAAILFVVVQNPQEAVMWIAALADELVGMFVLCGLLLWLRGCPFLSALCYVAGLFSKESAIALLLLLPSLDFWKERRLALRREYLYFLIPTAVYVSAWVLSRNSNYLVSTGDYELGLHAFRVLATSLFKLTFPWLYIALALFLIARKKIEASGLGMPLSWMALTMLPYIFLTYQHHIPSRHMYLASMGLVWAIAILVSRLSPRRVAAYLLAFVSYNISYLWVVKDAQFELRAAPTSRLIEQLRNRQPTSLLVSDFPLNPWIAKEAAGMVPGWKPEMLEVRQPNDSDRGRAHLRWDATKQLYRGKL